MLCCSAFKDLQIKCIKIQNYFSPWLLVLVDISNTLHCELRLQRLPWSSKVVAWSCRTAEEYSTISHNGLCDNGFHQFSKRGTVFGSQSHINNDNNVTQWTRRSSFTQNLPSPNKLRSHRQTNLGYIYTRRRGRERERMPPGFWSHKRQWKGVCPRGCCKSKHLFEGRFFFSYGCRFYLPFFSFPQNYIWAMMFVCIVYKCSRIALCVYFQICRVQK